jgi:hypothetical protein
VSQINLCARCGDTPSRENVAGGYCLPCHRNWMAMRRLFRSSEAHSLEQVAVSAGRAVAKIVERALRESYLAGRESVRRESIGRRAPHTKRRGP